MVFSPDEIRRNEDFYGEWMPPEEAERLARLGGPDDVFGRDRSGTQITGRDIRDRAEQVARTIRRTDGRFARMNRRGDVSAGLLRLGFGRRMRFIDRGTATSADWREYDAFGSAEDDDEIEDDFDEDFE